ncbi:LysR family transcriptional regulator [Roseovarius pelagicus]|uniref:LysR family transcriptional regulator n=1 Tax=Roseovarius pelagicus TaxID=2980108 RepID=A0ABY6DCN2_9RHOB|nr:LysR family transcriptional regulator [Roseovarius pelagicus]UXX83325.1 LysR family transcriptional regulator [Roseovarius pelagicus]
MHIRMNWKAITFDWNQVRAFLATVELGSLSAAARALGLAQPTLGRQVSGLEDALGIVLFERRGKSLMLTASGLDLLEHVRAMGEAATRISLTASGHSQTIEGKVRISASDVVAAHMLAPILDTLRIDAPGIEVDIVATNAISDLRRREADIAIRHARPDQPDLIARLLRDSWAGLYASRPYIERFGIPARLEDLNDAAFIGFDADHTRLLSGLNALGLSLTENNIKLASQSGVVAWEMVRQGLGIGVMMHDVADRCPEMIRVLPDLPVIPVPIWLTTHRELHTSRRIRMVFDHLAAALG